MSEFPSQEIKSAAPPLAWATLVLGLALLSPPAVAEVTEPGPRSVEVVLPSQQRERLELTGRIEGSYEFLYEGEVLDGTGGAEWISRLVKKMDRSQAVFERARKAGLLSFCSPPSPLKSRVSLVFLPRGKVPALFSKDDRSGYFHPSNPGPILESAIWNDEELETLIFHEMIHAWCKSAPGSKLGDRWLEEGVADWVAFEVTGKAPQINLTRYFDNECRPTLYGSSFLWVVSRFAAGSPDRMLAELHLGLRKDVAFGSLNLGPRALCPPAAPGTESTPHGQILKACPAGASLCIPLWSTPWGDVVSEPTGSASQDRFFYFTGQPSLSIQPSKKDGDAERVRG